MATEATKIPFVEAAAPATPAASRVVVYAKSDGLMYSKDDAGTETLMSGTSANPQLTTIELGHASDTTLARVSAGVVSIEGTNIVKAGAATSSGLTQATSRLLGRTTASTGAIEEITVGSGLSLAAGSLTATGSGSVPGWIAKYIGTTDTTHFYWDGNDLAGFTEQKPSGNSTWVEGLNLISVLMDSQATDPDAVAQLIAKTISTGDEWEVGINVSALMSDSGGDTTGNRSCGIIMSDGTATTSNCVAAHVQVANDGSSVILVGRHGTLTSVATAPWVSIGQGPAAGGWLWIKLKYSASNTFQAYFSSSFGAQYSVFEEADISKTMTPTHIGIFGWNHAAGPAMFTFGPLLKV